MQTKVGCKECEQKQNQLRKMAEGYQARGREVEAVQGALRKTQRDLTRAQDYSRVTDGQLRVTRNRSENMEQQLQLQLQEANDKIIAKSDKLKAEQVLVQTMDQQIIAMEDQIDATQVQLQGTRDRLGNTQSQMLAMDKQFLVTQNELAATKTTLAEYRQFASVVRPVMALAGAAACAYAVYNNPVMLAEGATILTEGVKSLLCRNVGTAMAYEGLSLMVKGYGLEVATAVAGLVGYATSSLVGPAAVYAVVKLANAIVNGVATFIYETVKYFVYELPVGTVKELIAILQKAYEYRAMLMELVGAGLFCYYSI